MKINLSKLIGLALLSISVKGYCISTAIPEGNIVVGIIPPTEPCRLHSFQPDQSPSSNNLLLNAKSVPVSDDRITLWGLNLNNAGNQIQVAPGEKIQAVSAFIYNCPFCQTYSINQIIIGIKGIGAQSCIFNGGTIAQGIRHFSITAPEQAGTYTVQFRYAQADNCADAVQDWWNVDHPPADSSTIGTIIVKKSGF